MRALIAAYRVRSVLLAVAVVPLLVIAVSGWFPALAGFAAVKQGVALGAVLIGALAIALAFLGPRMLPERATRVVHAPVTGRWLAMNSPATKVPSHGVRAYGQAYAIDLVAEPTAAESGAAGPAAPERPAFGTGGAWRRAHEYPAFGEPVLAMIDGTVVAASDWRRDHHARSSLWSLLYLMLLEAPVRELGGPGFVVGNHVVIRGDDGVYALVAHLQRRSVEVSVGERVTAGERIARCGNSGNSSEPHVHAQLMDRAHPLIAQGVPMAFAGIRIGDDSDDGDGSADGEGETADGLPPDGEHLRA